MKPIIGILGRSDIASDDDKVICIYENTRISVVKEGGIAFLILPNQPIEYEGEKNIPKLTKEEKKELEQLIDMCDGLLIPGGYKWYEFDEYVYEYALEKNMPILGICAGMQMMCMIDCKEIDEKKLVKNETLIDHHQRDKKYVHSVSLVDNTLLKEIVNKDKLKVNSKHYYHVEKVNSLKISAYSEDGLIEAVENPDKEFVIGTQWHPETMIDYDETSRILYNKFIEKSKKYHLKNKK